ncbi:Flp family type IVb pilin [Modestobacter muralis]|uniref:Flp family type IVb pilin n=1 Tax=Modestobacter muralis TaxID=1608614 RepID=A0A6P0H7Y6_9ACTN|nr:Flp family type IVb pilin [Modestobacter muralis]NEN50896.1 Flp family type IVb pilin [Modestobacter muralis]
MVWEQPQGRLTRRVPAGRHPSGAVVIAFYATLSSFVSTAADRLKREEKGATAVEYGLMVGLIAVAIIAAVALLGDNLTDLFNGIAGEVDDATPAAG